MIRINLLPHREIKRKARQEQFAVLTGITLFLGILTVGVVHLIITGQIEYQESRNTYMTNQIAVLDKQIDEINISTEKLRIKRTDSNESIEIIEDVKHFQNTITGSIDNKIKEIISRV